MSLKQIINFLNKYKIDILSMGVFFGILGIVIYFLFPAKFVAKGNIFVSRDIQTAQTISESTNPPTQEFAYEGFYAQQNASMYTSTVIGLIESENISYRTLLDIGIPTTTSNIKKFERKIGAKKIAPQLIELEIKENTAKQATKSWNTLVENLMVTNQQLTQEGDPNLKITVVVDSPIVVTTYKNPLLNFGIGLVAGTLIAMFVLALQDFAAEALNSNKKPGKK